MSAEEETCNNCYELLRDCDCGETETYHDMEAGAICPYCGELQEDSGDNEFYVEGDTERICSDCNETFTVEGIIDWSWKAYKK